MSACFVNMCTLVGNENQTNLTILAYCNNSIRLLSYFSAHGYVHYSETKCDWSVSNTVDWIAQQHLVGHTAVEMDLAVVECKPENIQKFTHTTAMNWPLKASSVLEMFPCAKNNCFQYLHNPN